MAFSVLVCLSIPVVMKNTSDLIISKGFQSLLWLCGFFFFFWKKLNNNEKVALRVYEKREIFLLVKIDLF